MQMPGRTFSANNSSYRYGFNGKEMDNEPYGQGNEYDYGFRIYNPGIGRFLSVDPITKDYPELTPYQFASNTPIQAIDLDGLEKYYVFYQPHDGKDNILRVETDNSLKYFSVSINNIPIKPKVVEYIKLDEYGKTIDRSGDIALKNYGSTIYVGPFNPKDKHGNDTYKYPAINSLDAAGKKHDQGYTNARAAGVFDAVYLLRTLNLDKQLVKDAQAVVDLYNGNKVDPVNHQKVSEETKSAAEGVVTIFTNIVKEKSVRLAIVNAVKSMVDDAKETTDKIIETSKQGVQSLDNIGKLGKPQ
jgi:RHS repeat-associated protein